MHESHGISLGNPVLLQKPFMCNLLISLCLYGATHMLLPPALLVSLCFLNFKFPVSTLMIGPLGLTFNSYPRNFAGSFVILLIKVFSSESVSDNSSDKNVEIFLFYKFAISKLPFVRRI